MDFCQVSPDNASVLYCRITENNHYSRLVSGVDSVLFFHFLAPTFQHRANGPYHAATKVQGFGGKNCISGCDKGICWISIRRYMEVHCKGAP